MSFHALKTSGSSLKNVQWGIDTVSHNIANANTTGYKKQQANFAAIINSHDSLSNSGLSGTAITSVTTQFSQGSVKNTGVYSDLAIQGEGFFTVQDSTGEMVYTRAGHFNVDRDGNFVDPQGNYLMSTGGNRITMPVDAIRVEIGTTGQINALYDETQGFQPYDQIQLASFTNQPGLEKIGGNNYRETTSSGSPSFSYAGEIGSNTAGTFLVSGALETANTNIGESLVELISFQRSYQAISKTTETANELLQTTINLAS